MKSIFIVRCAFLFLLTVISFFSKVYGQQKKDSIHFFQGTWDQAVAEAKEKNKYIFLDAYASWCGPCKTMDREVYRSASVASYFNQKFVSFRVDMEKGEGPVLAKRFPSIDGYPSLLFFGTKGNLCKTILGSRSSPVFLKEAKLVE